MKFPWKQVVIFVATITSIIFVTGLLLPEYLLIPVKGATKSDWNSKSFWFSPWGKSGVHKGIDIFAKKGTPVIAVCSGVVVSAESNDYGGNVVSILGPKWRIHYYAHMECVNIHNWKFVKQGSVIGSVGTTGNAAGKAPHLHYAIITQIPYVWKYTPEKYGFDKMFFLNPHEKLIHRNTRAFVAN